MRSNKGIVVSKDGKKYAVIDNKLYDYFSYINTGVLLPVSKNKSIKKVINIPKIDSFIKEDDLRIFSNKIEKILKNLKITNEAEI